MKQYELSQKFSEAKSIRYFLGDVRDKERLKSLFKYRYHYSCCGNETGSASEYNPTECIATNINGAENIIDAV